MKYHLEDQEEIIEAWLSAFAAMSISQFAWFQEDLQFPAVHSANLMELCHDFVIEIMLYLERSVPEQTKFHSFYESDYTVALQSMWNSMFNYLENLGNSHIIYNWGKNTFYYYEHVANTSLSKLLKTSSWDDLLLDWTLEVARSPWELLHFGETKTLELKLLIAKYHIKSLKARINVDYAEKIPNKTSWERFVFDGLDIGSWISNQAQYVIKFNKWKDILTVLSKDDMQTLQDWGQRQFSKIGILEFVPITDLRI